MGSVEYDELRHDTEGMARTRAAQMHLGEALDDIVERVMGAQKVPGLHLDLQCFLEDQADLHELVSTAIVQRDWTALEDVIVSRLRAKLEDHEVVVERAADFAESEAEDARARERDE